MILRLKRITHDWHNGKTIWNEISRDSRAIKPNYTREINTLKSGYTGSISKGTTFDL